MKDGTLTAQLMMPEAPYRMRVTIQRIGDQAIKVDMTSVGFEEGSFELKRVAP